MQGRRLYTSDQQLFYESPVSSWRFRFKDLQPGDYWCCDGKWRGKAPNGLFVNLQGHEVKENSDRTITVSPSILVRGTIGESPDEISWHGFLENGIWRECE